MEASLWPLNLQQLTILVDLWHVRCRVVEVRDGHEVGLEVKDLGGGAAVAVDELSQVLIEVAVGESGHSEFVVGLTTTSNLGQCTLGPAPLVHALKARRQIYGRMKHWRRHVAWCQAWLRLPSKAMRPWRRGHGSRRARPISGRRMQHGWCLGHWFGRNGKGGAFRNFFPASIVLSCHRSAPLAGVCHRRHHRALVVVRINVGSKEVLDGLPNLVQAALVVHLFDEAVQRAAGVARLGRALRHDCEWRKAYTHRLRFRKENLAEGHIIG